MKIPAFAVANISPVAGSMQLYLTLIVHCIGYLGNPYSRSWHLICEPDGNASGYLPKTQASQHPISLANVHTC